jgi:hypothetical protein
MAAELLRHRKGEIVSHLTARPARQQYPKIVCPVFGTGGHVSLNGRCGGHFRLFQRQYHLNPHFTGSCSVFLLFGTRIFDRENDLQDVKNIF